MINDENITAKDCVAKCTPEVMAERRRHMEEADYKIVVMSADDENV